MASRRLGQQRTLIMSAVVEWLWWDVLAAKCLARSTRMGDLLFVPFRSRRGLMVLRDRRPCFYFGHDGPTGSSPLVIRQEDLSVGIKMYTSCHWLASLLVAC